jgi:hypothetical protein
MNERIQELERQATDYYSNGQERIFDRQKFAQLIVQECIRELDYTVLDTQELRRDKSTDYQVGWEDGMFDAGETIKLHFGVEE